MKTCNYGEQKLLANSSQKHSEIRWSSKRN